MYETTLHKLQEVLLRAALQLKLDGPTSNAVIASAYILYLVMWCLGNDANYKNSFFFLLIFSDVSGICIAACCNCESSFLMIVWENIFIRSPHFCM